MTNLKELLLKLNQNHNTLRECEAKYANNSPLDLLNQIDDHKQAIALTEQTIRGDLSEAEWHEALEPLLVAVQARTGEAASGVTIGDQYLRSSWSLRRSHQRDAQIPQNYACKTGF